MLSVELIPLISLSNPFRANEKQVATDGLNLRFLTSEGFLQFFAYRVVDPNVGKLLLWPFQCLTMQVISLFLELPTDNCDLDRPLSGFSLKQGDPKEKIF